MSWSKISGMVADAAPALGALLAPVTGGASLAIGSAIGALLGTSDKPEDIAKALKANPELALKLKELDTRIAQMSHDEKLALLADTQNARNMQVEALKQDDLFSKRFVYYFAIGITSVSFIYIFLITFANIPEANVRFADTILGFLLGVGLAQIFQFFYGSTKASGEKTTHIVDLFKGKK